MQEGRIHVELINGLLLREGGSRAEYGVALTYALLQAWRHEFGTT